MRCTKISAGSDGAVWGIEGARHAVLQPIRVATLTVHQHIRCTEGTRKIFCWESNRNVWQERPGGMKILSVASAREYVCGCARAIPGGNLNKS